MKDQNWGRFIHHSAISISSHFPFRFHRLNSRYMSSDGATQITQLLVSLKNSDRSQVAAKLMPLVYDEFRELAARQLRKERPDHTLQPTALVHEAYLRLIDQTRVDWQGRTHFFAVGAQAIRRILVDHARNHKRQKRGGGAARMALDEEVALAPQRDEEILALDEALKKLAALDERQAQVVEMRFFGGM